MIVWRQNLVPLRGYAAMAVFPFVLVRKDWWDGASEAERIHCWQQVETLLVLFWLLYGVFYVVNLIRYRNHKEAYRNVAFEREAYGHQDDEGYAKNKPFWRSEEHTSELQSL